MSRLPVCTLESKVRDVKKEVGLVLPASFQGPWDAKLTGFTFCPLNPSSDPERFLYHEFTLDFVTMASGVIHIYHVKTRKKFSTDLHLL